MIGSVSQPTSATRGGLRHIVRRGFRGVSRGLGWRVSLILIGSLAILLGGTGWLALKLHRQHLYSLLEENAIGIGETILSSAHYAMLENDQVYLSRIFASIGQRENVLALRLVDARGRVAYSNYPEEVGYSTDLQAPLCRGCHSGKEVRSPETLRDGLQLYSLPPGEGALGLGVPILNAPECSNGSCHIHPPSQRVLGMLDLELSTGPLEMAMREAGAQVTLFALITVIVIPTTVGILAWRVVHRPIRALLAGTRRLAAGDLAYRIPQVPSGELGELAASFNEMSRKLQAAKVELEAWNMRLEAKVAEKTHELEQTRDQMVFAQKMASLGKLAAVVAHEINNPLAGVLVFTRLVRRKVNKLGRRYGGPGEGDGFHEIEEKLLTVETEIARCGDIVRNLLLFSRQKESAAVAADLNAIVEKSLRLVQHKADLSGVDVGLDLDPSLPETKCEPLQMQQAILAAIMNSLEAMPDGGTLHVRTRSEPAARAVVVEIEDTGVGIPDEIKEKIYEPFFSTKDEGKGTGLGMSVMYGILQRHHGRVEIQSEPGRGAKVRLVLPLRIAGGGTPGSRKEEHET